MRTKKVPEGEYEFVLILTGISRLTREVEDALFKAGCDDATLSVRLGRFYLTFSRSAPTLKNAILSAIQDIRQAGIGADVLRVDACDLVTQAEIARRIRRPRQVVHQFIMHERGPGEFPPPVCHISDESPLWRWCEVAYWLQQNDMIKLEVLLEAEQVAVINTLLELQHQKQRHPKLLEEVRQLVG
jgi:hypothetical protein